MDNECTLRFKNCRVYATNPAVNQLDLRIQIGIKSTILTPPQYATRVEYRESSDGSLIKSNETIDEIETEKTAVSYVGVWRERDYNGDYVANGYTGVSFPASGGDAWYLNMTDDASFDSVGLFNPYHAFYTRTSRWSLVKESDSNSFIVGKTQGSVWTLPNWTKIDSDVPDAVMFTLNFAGNSIYTRGRLLLAYATATENDGIVTVSPCVFGTWETTEDVVLRAVGQEQIRTSTIGGSTTVIGGGMELTYGRARIKVEPLFND